MADDRFVNGEVLLSLSHNNMNDLSTRQTGSHQLCSQRISDLYTHTINLFFKDENGVCCRSCWLKTIEDENIAPKLLHLPNIEVAGVTDMIFHLIFPNL